MEEFMRAAAAGADALSAAVWGVPMLVLMLAAGLYLTVCTGFFQFRRFGFSMRVTFGRLAGGPRAGRGAVTPLQAMSTSLAAALGTGNITGVTTAVALGGPGAVFWLWVSALVGMGTKYAEILLAVRYRVRDGAGDWVGGPMYYILRGMGTRWRWLASLFCVFGALAAFGIGNAVQVGSITDSVHTAVAVFAPEAAADTGRLDAALGLFLAVLVGFIMFGGMKRIGRAAELLVPFMAGAYILAALAVIVTHAQLLGHAFGLIFRGAFAPESVVGGAAGISLRGCVTWGMRRGVFSNEAGLGSAPIAHAAAETKSPVEQGAWGVFEVFVDTILLCTLTALPLLMTGVMEPGVFAYGTDAATALNVAALATVFGERLGSLLIAGGLTLFALATILGWSLYGVRCAQFLLGPGCVLPYRLAFLAVIVVGATADLSLSWRISDALNGLMAVPNLVGVLALSGTAARLTRDYFRRGG